MYKFWLSIFIVLLLSISGVFALSFNTTNPKIVHTGLSYNNFRTKICDGNNTFAIAWGNEWNLQEIKKSDYTAYGSTTDLCPLYLCHFGDIACDNGNYSIVTTGSEFSGAGNYKAQFGLYSLASHGYSSLGSQSSASGSPIANNYLSAYGTSITAVSNPDIIFWFKVSDPDTIRYSLTKSFGSTFGDGSGSLSIPAYYPLKDLQAVKCGVYGDGKPLIHLLGMDSATNLVWDHIFEWTGSGLTYIETVEIGDIADTHYPPLQYQYSSYCDEANKMLYFIFGIDSSDDNILNRYYIDVFDTREGYVYHQTELDTTITNLVGYGYSHSSIVKLSNGYHLLGFIDSSGNFDILEENDYCIPSAWEDQGCLEDHMKQTRTFTPSDCSSDTIRYVDNQYCSLKNNRTHGIYTQNYKYYFNYSSCLTDWAEVGTPISCMPSPFQIPSNCINANMTNEAIPIFDYYPILGLSGQYQLTSCNPNYDCFMQNYSCVYQLNVSSSKDYNSYIAGEYATGSGSVYVPLSCRNKIAFITGGVLRYRLQDTISLVCGIPCKEEQVCLNNDYMAITHQDCSITNQTYCSNGCTNNVCAETVSVSNLPFFNDPINAVFEGVGNIFKLSTTSKFILWSIITGITTFTASIGLATLKLGDTIKTILTLIALGLMMLIGIIVGWFPIWIIITISLIGLIVVVLKH
jgi:hypothetical protein